VRGRCAPGVCWEVIARHRCCVFYHVPTSSSCTFFHKFSPCLQLSLNPLCASPLHPAVWQDDKVCVVACSAGRVAARKRLQRIVAVDVQDPVLVFAPPKRRGRDGDKQGGRGEGAGRGARQSCERTQARAPASARCPRGVSSVRANVSCARTHGRRTNSNVRGHTTAGHYSLARVTIRDFSLPW